MQRIGDPLVGRNVAEQRFDVVCEGRRVPAIMWQPASGNATGVVLQGHGGTGHKRMDYILSLARTLVRHHGIASISIDGPGHGDRGPGEATMSEREFERAWASPTATADIVADWRAVLDAVLAEQESDLPVGYFGLSMGTMMGVPVVAAEPRIRAAVLGLMGVWGPNRAALEKAAPDVQVPVRFLAQWDDEIVPRDAVLDLFDRLGSPDKALRAHPGRHAAVPPHEIREVSTFLAGHLLRA